jgi:DNA-binding MarR family transcriptional regulator
MTAMKAPEPAPAATSTGDQALIDALARTSFAVMGVLNRIGAEHDLSLTQLRVLAILRDRRGKMSDLADYLGLDKSTISGLVDRAEKRGLLQRAPNPRDGRAVDVFLSAEGARLAEIGAIQTAEALSPMIGQLTNTEARRLTALLERILAPASQPPASRLLFGGRIRWPVSGHPVAVRVRGLPDLDQITVGIADVAADFVLVVFRRREELSAPCAPFGVHGLDVPDPYIDEAADPVGIARRLQGDRRLVVGRAAADVDDDPAVG